MSGDENTETMKVYRMRPASSRFEWFAHHKNKREMQYDSGERLANFEDNGRGRLYYRSGRLALDYYDAEESNAQQRFLVYSSGEPDERGRRHPITILATFDYIGNGIVFDHSGKIRLKYNQTEGVVLDRGIGPVTKWKWHTLSDPPRLKQVMIDTQTPRKGPAILELEQAHANGDAIKPKANIINQYDDANELTANITNLNLLAKEFNSLKKQTQSKHFQIKMKALKINEHFSLKILDQASVYLIFKDGKTKIKLNIGMILEQQEKNNTDDVGNDVERLPDDSDSLEALQRSIAYAQQYETARSKREHRIRQPVVASTERPLRPGLTLVSSKKSRDVDYSRCKKPNNNLYYNSRLV